MKCRADEIRVEDVVIWNGNSQKVISCRQSSFHDNRQFIRFNLDFERIIITFDRQGNLVDNIDGRNTLDYAWIANNSGHFLKEHIFEVVK